MLEQLIAKMTAGEGFVVIRGTPVGLVTYVFDTSAPSVQLWAEVAPRTYMLEQPRQLQYALEHDEWRGPARVLSLSVWQQIKADTAEFWDRQYRCFCSETVGAWNEEPWFSF